MELSVFSLEEIGEGNCVVGEHWTWVVLAITKEVEGGQVFSSIYRISQ